MNLNALLGPGFALVAFTAVALVLTLLAVAVVYALRLQPQGASTPRVASPPASDSSSGLPEHLVVLLAAAATAAVGRSRIRRVRRLPAADLPSSPWSVTGRAVLQGSHVVPTHAPKP